jgi:hypothetical protein
LFSALFCLFDEFHGQAACPWRKQGSGLAAAAGACVGIEDVLQERSLTCSAELSIPLPQGQVAIRPMGPAEKRLHWW